MIAQIFTLLFLLMLALTDVCAEQIRIPFGQEKDDLRWEYTIALLQRVLDQTAQDKIPDQIIRGAYRLQARRLFELESGVLDVAAITPDADFEKSRVIFIPVPIQKGLHGWRLFLSNSHGRQLLTKVQTLDELKKIPLGFNPGWGDWSILEKAGFQYVDAQDYPNYPRMLQQDRFAYISRTVVEIYPEEAMAQRQGYTDVKVAPKLALRYPSDLFFVVNPAKPELATRIAQGLKLMRESGEFDRLFEKHFSSALQRADLKHRKIFNIENPYLPSSVPRPPGPLWWQP